MPNRYDRTVQRVRCDSFSSALATFSSVAGVDGSQGSKTLLGSICSETLGLVVVMSVALKFEQGRHTRTHVLFHLQRLGTRAYRIVPVTNLRHFMWAVYRRLFTR